MRDICYSLLYWWYLFLLVSLLYHGNVNLIEAKLQRTGTSSGVVDVAIHEHIVLKALEMVYGKIRKFWRCELEKALSSVSRAWLEILYRAQKYQNADGNIVVKDKLVRFQMAIGTLLWIGPRTRKFLSGKEFVYLSSMSWGINEHEFKGGRLKFIWWWKF